MDLESIFKLLREDRKFFDSYRGRFVESFFGKVGVNPSLNTLVSKLYIMMFSFERNPLKELYTLSYTTAKSKFRLKKHLLDATLSLTRDYIDHVKDTENSLRKTKALISLVDIYMGTVEDAYTKYLSELEDKVEHKERTHKEEAEIIQELFRAAFKKGMRKLVVKTVFKGLFVDSGSEILEVSDRSIKIKTSHMGVYKPGDRATLIAPFIPKPVSAVIREIDGDKRYITVEIEAFNDVDVEKRKHVRVVPEEKVKINLSWKANSLTGIVADISIKGVGIYAENPAGLEKDTPVKVGFTLSNTEFELFGTVRHISPHGNVFRIGVELETDMKTEDILSDYVVKRQLEILRLMKTLSPI